MGRKKREEKEAKDEKKNCIVYDDGIVGSGHERMCVCR